MSEFAKYISGDAGRRRRSIPDDLIVRPAGLADLDEIAEIAAAREEEPLGHWRSAIERVYELSAKRRALLLVASVKERIAGYGKIGYFSAPSDSLSNVAPEGWYLTGLIVRPAFRRRSLGSRLTLARLAWIAARSDSAYYFANERNRVSIELHRSLGFVDLTRDFTHPHASFEGGGGILFVCDLRDPIHLSATGCWGQTAKIAQ